MKRKLYCALAQAVDAYHRCLQPGANDSQSKYASKHRDRAEAMAKENMPSGSGFDGGTSLVIESSSEDMIVFSTSFHHMNEYGFYDEWTDHKVFVNAHLAHGLTLRITGSDRNGIKEYMHELFVMALNVDIDE